MKYVYLSLIVLIISTTAVLGHSWYPSDCCSGQDCFPVPCSQLIENGEGNWLWDNLVFLKEKVKPSLDNLCHVCISNNVPRCAFIVQGT